VQCPECHKDVSSKASNCIHCGFPLKSVPKDEDVPTVREANYSKFGLGIFFMVIAIIAIVRGFIVVQPSDVEKMQQDLVDMAQDAERTQEALGRLAGNSSYAREAHQSSLEYQSKLDKMISDRHIKAACWFAPGGLLLVTGLIMCAYSKSQAK